MGEHLFLIVFFGYILSLGFYFAYFELAKDALLNLARKIILSSLALHLLFIASLLFRAGGLGGPRSFPEYVYTVSFFAVFLPFLAEWRYRAKHALLFSLPLVLFFCLLAMLIGHKNAVVTTPAPWWIWVHLGFIFSGFAALVTAAAGAIMYLLQSAQLKSKRPGELLLKLPSLETLDRLHFSTLVWGVILFSMGILSGLFWASKVPNISNIFMDPKAVLSFLACPLYWGVLSLRLSPLRRGKRIAYSTLFIFLVFFVMLVGTYYCPVGFHGRGL